MARDFKHFNNDVLRAGDKIASYIAQDAPRHVGKMAVDHYKDNFNREGFVDAGLQKWREVKRRQPPIAKGAAGSRKILHGETLELRNSIQYRPEKARTVIFSDKEYFRVHNEGLRAGRGKGFQMPKRQMVGHSIRLDENYNTIKIAFKAK